MSRNTSEEPLRIREAGTNEESHIKILPVIIATVTSIIIILVIIMCSFGSYLRKRRLKAKERSGNGSTISPNQAGVIQTEFIEFVLPYTSAEPTDEEYSEQDTGQLSRPLSQGYGSSSGGGGGGGGNNGPGLLTVPQQVRRVIKLDSIAPALYLSSEGEEEQASWLPANMNFGKVGFSIRYKLIEQRLMITIIGAKGLPMKRKSNHPHIKVVILPDKSCKAFTKIQKNTTEPIYNEEFEFSFKVDEAPHKILKISACDFDKFSRRIAIGHAFFPLKSLGISKENTADVSLLDVWKNLYPKHMGNEEARGEISLSLSYCPEVRTLRLGVHKVKNLNTEQDEKDIACLYAKLTLFENDKIMKTKKTAMKRKTLEPDFDESFNIKIARKQLKDVMCTISVCSRNRYGTRKVIGRTQVGPYTHVSGPGADHWSDALQSPNSTVTQWHTLH